MGIGTNVRGRATRRALFDAAKRLFVEQGYAAVSHADIAAEAGIGRTTFYEHFASKEELLVKLVERELPDLVEEMLASIDPELDPEEELVELTKRMIEFVATDHLGLILHTEVPKLSAESQAAIARSHAGLAEAFVRVYREGVAAGRFRPMEPELAGRLIDHVIMAAGRVVMDAPDPRARVAEVAETTASFLLEGLRSR
ncbi:MAG TPA: TetR/AcrR family transcriptional regulator [Actinobacteria bacterium]|nr:TetR/AcrR family transcriptional regulator [Actinomycetota bacterium]